MGRIAIYGSVSTALAVWVVLGAFRQQSNFFAAAVHLSKSHACMMILWNFALWLTFVFGNIMRAIFFGPLRALEVEMLQERAWIATSETLLALTLFRNNFDSSFVTLFVVLHFLKVFHWLMGDRVRTMDQAPAIPTLFHIRMVGTILCLALGDIIGMVWLAESILLEGPSVKIMFAMEYAIMFINLIGQTIAYIIQIIDLRTEEPWEGKALVVTYFEMAIASIKLTAYVFFFSLIFTFYGLPLNILRDVYLTGRGLLTKWQAMRRVQNATRDLDERIPNATAEDLTDGTCIICREDMEVQPAADVDAAAQQPPRPPGPNMTPKKLPCGHVFHFHCMRSWLERQSNCPTCRRPVLNGDQAAQQQPPAPQPAQAPGAPQAGQAAQARAAANAAASQRTAAATAAATGAPGSAGPMNTNLDTSSQDQPNPLLEFKVPTTYLKSMSQDPTLNLPLYAASGMSTSVSKELARRAKEEKNAAGSGSQSATNEADRNIVPHPFDYTGPGPEPPAERPAGSEAGLSQSAETSSASRAAEKAAAGAEDKAQQDVSPASMREMRAAAAARRAALSNNLRSGRQEVPATADASPAPKIDLKGKGRAIDLPTVDTDAHETDSGHLDRDEFDALIAELERGHGARDVPRLIPLFDLGNGEGLSPLASVLGRMPPTTITPSLLASIIDGPPAARLRRKATDGPDKPNTGDDVARASDGPQAAEISSARLKKLSNLTKEGIMEQMRVLRDVKRTTEHFIEELSKVVATLPDDS